MCCRRAPEYIVDTSEFDQTKARLAAFENRKKVLPKEDINKPTLRRTETAQNGNGNGNGNADGTTNGNGDDRPTLQRATTITARQPENPGQF